MTGQTVISVNKIKVEELLKSGTIHKFVIPEYQRPYSWTEEQVSTLFEDITEFASNTGGSERKGALYFWVVSCLTLMKKKRAKLLTGNNA